MEQQYSIPSKNTDGETTAKGFSNSFGQKQQNAHKSNNRRYKSNNSDENWRERKIFQNTKK